MYTHESPVLNLSSLSGVNYLVTTTFVQTLNCLEVKKYIHPYHIWSWTEL